MYAHTHKHKDMQRHRHTDNNKTYADVEIHMLKHNQTNEDTLYTWKGKDNNKVIIKMAYVAKLAMHSEKFFPGGLQLQGNRWDIFE